MIASLLSAPSLGMVIKLEELWSVIETTVIFVAIGLVVFALAFLIVVLVAPFSVKKEIEEDQNTSLAIIIGSVIIGIAMIISAAIHGSQLYVIGNDPDGVEVYRSPMVWNGTFDLWAGLMSGSTLSVAMPPALRDAA